MKKYARKISMLLVAVMLFMLTGCGKNNDDSVSVLKEGQSDLEYVQSKGTLIVGITDYAPLDYRDGDSWTGFDADLVKLFAESLGVTVEFKEIDWDTKTELLEKGSIDCIWNGMTLTDELKEKISCSEPYLSNAQVIVLRKGNMKQYNTAEACQHLLFAVEEGSTGESLLKEMKYRYVSYPTQLEALQSVLKMESDATVIDTIMAEYYTAEVKEFDDLGFDIALNDEKLCIGLRKNSDLTEKVNEFLTACYEDGTINSLAEKYGIDNAVLK